MNWLLVLAAVAAGTCGVAWSLINPSLEAANTVFLASGVIAIAAIGFALLLVFKSFSLPENQRKAGENSRMSDRNSGQGGRGGNAKVGVGLAIAGQGGKGGPIGCGNGGDGGSAEVSVNGIAIGGNGGDAGQANGVGGKGGASTLGPILKAFGIPNIRLANGDWLYDAGKGGDGASARVKDK